MRGRDTAKGSITVEATLVFPIFFFVIVGFIYFFQIFKTQIKLQGNITDIAQEASRYAYLYDVLANTEKESTKSTDSTQNKESEQSKADQTVKKL